MRLLCFLQRELEILEQANEVSVKDVMPTTFTAKLYQLVHYHNSSRGVPKLGRIIVCAFNKGICAFSYVESRQIRIQPSTQRPTACFRELLKDSGTNPVRLPARRLNPVEFWHKTPSQLTSQQCLQTRPMNERCRMRLAPAHSASRGPRDIPTFVGNGRGSGTGDAIAPG